MSGGGRRANVRGAFVATGHADDRRTVSRILARVRRTPSLEGRRVLLVDDIMTTGSTVHECARALKAAGAQKVYVVTVAR
jgi:predicted amidophosphoribosyltransferase